MSTLFVVGIGPGDETGMTGRARAALNAADILCGYTHYVELVRPLFPDKEFLATGMKKEVERCRAALAAACAGQAVAMVCSGDAGVYGMAGLVYELAQEYPPVDIEIVPGVSAAMSGAALLGAPLGHDFAVVSLSDLLTPWSVIEKRLCAVGEADFALCLYNPASKGRQNYLQKACDLLLQYKKPETICGWARNIGRLKENTGVLPLAALRDFKADMFTTVFVGNAATKNIGGKIVTPRGYGVKP